MERSKLAELLKQEAVRKMVTTLQERDDDAPGELVDAAYWIKGCSSLGRLRYAAMLRVGKLRTGSLCLLDIKEATKPAAPRAARPRCLKTTRCEWSTAPRRFLPMLVSA